MEHNLAAAATVPVSERRRHIRRMADKIAQLYVTRDRLRSGYDARIATAFQYARAYPIVAFGAAFALGYMVGRLGARAAAMA